MEIIFDTKWKQKSRKSALKRGLILTYQKSRTEEARAQNHILDVLLIFGDAFLYPGTHYFISRKHLNDLRKYTIPSISRSISAVLEAPAG